MAKKHILVLGLKTFGLSIVKQLSNYNCEVLALDKSMDRVEEADEFSTQALQIDIRDLDRMDTLSLNSFDVAIITVDNIEESIMAALIFQENDIPQIIVRATSQMHKNHPVGELRSWGGPSGLSFVSPCGPERGGSRQDS